MCIAPEERECLEHLAEAWNIWTRLLPPKDETDEFRHGIHQLQNMVAMRIAQRTVPSVFKKQ